MLLDEFVDEVHGLEGVRREPLKPSLGVIQGGQIPFRLLPDVDVAESGAEIIQDRFKFGCGHDSIIRGTGRCQQVFWSFLGFAAD